MPKLQRRFAQEFQDEAVRLAETSGRPRREIARDLGIGLIHPAPLDRSRPGAPDRKAARGRPEGYGSGGETAAAGE
jgi:transposase-like protein